MKILLLALVLAAVTAEVIPLNYKQVSLRNFNAKKEKLASQEFKNEVLSAMNELNDPLVPVKDYMDTQYFVNIEIGHPA